MQDEPYQRSQTQNEQGYKKKMTAQWTENYSKGKDKVLKKGHEA